MARLRWGRLQKGIIIICACSLLHVCNVLFFHGGPTPRRGSQSGIHLSASELEKKSDQDLLQLLGLQATTEADDFTDSRYAPFDPSQPKLVLLLSYQRSGSTFVGTSLFMNNPDIFYVYEPLDSVYTAMYGTLPGLNIPSDITTFKNGSLRVPPDHELAAVRWTMESLFSCNVTALWHEMMMHYAWEFFALKMTKIKPYVFCLKKNSITGRQLRVCKGHLKGHSGNRFSANSKHERVHLQYRWLGNKSALDGNLELQEKFARYDSCVKELAIKLPKCTTVLEGLCSSQQVRAIKTVRATMDSVEPLLKKYSNLRLLHLVRDPRGAVSSRNRLWWTKGAYETSNLTRQAQVYCQTISHDLKIRRGLEERYPGRIQELVYEEFLQNPVKKVKEIYRFLGVHLPTQTKEALMANSNSSKVAGWRDSITVNQVMEIEGQCQDVYSNFNFEPS